MSALDILFDPIVKPQPAAEPDHGIVRDGESISVEIRPTGPQSIYMQTACEIMDTIAAKNSLTALIDVRKEHQVPVGVLYLGGLVNRFYNGSDAMWITCPRHMPPDRIRFQGRLGITKWCQLPVSHGSMQFVYFSWIDTNAGQLNALDLGLIMVPVRERWYRVFTNKNEAHAYYMS